MPGLWELVWGKPEIDPDRLASALDAEAGPGLDYRTRLLIRDSARALERHWGKERWSSWLRASRAREVIESIRQEGLEGEGFPSIERSVMERTGPDTVHQYLRELGLHARRPAELTIGGAIALILPGRLERSTQDIDLVDEVPVELRENPSLLEGLARRYGLHLTHFPSHYLPAGWQGRRRFLGAFGPLSVYLVDEQDIFLGKLFSRREKDRDDLRQLFPGLDREQLQRQLADSCSRLLADPGLAEAARESWYILTGEALPTPPTLASSPG
jgi:hypothetical protein